MLLTSVGCPRIPKFKNLTFGKVRVLDNFFNRFIVGEHVKSHCSTFIVTTFNAAFYTPPQHDLPHDLLHDLLQGPRLGRSSFRHRVHNCGRSFS